MTGYPSEAHLHRRYLNLWLPVVVVLIAALVALGAWVLVDQWGASSASNRADIIDNLNAAVNAGDEDAVRQLLAPHAIVVLPDGTRISDPDQVVSTLLIPHGVGFTVERAGPVAQTEDLAAAFARYEGGVELVVWRFRGGKIVEQRVIG